MKWGFGRRNGRIRYGRKIVGVYRYRPSYYVHNAKLGFVMTAYQNRRGF